MDAKRALILLFFVGISLFFHSVNGYIFNVSGTDRWIIHQSHINGFFVNDSLYFQDIKGNNSVLQVMEQNYEDCNTSNPIKKENGSSEFKLGRSGPFLFISGVKAQCEMGKKLHIMVLSKLHHPPAISPPESSPPENEPSGKWVKLGIEITFAIMFILMFLFVFLGFILTLCTDFPVNSDGVLTSPNQQVGFTV